MNTRLKYTQNAFIFGLSSLIVFIGSYAFFIFFYNLFSVRDDMILKVLFVIMAILSGIGLFFSIKALKEEPIKEALAKFFIAFSLNLVFFGVFLFYLMMSLIDFSYLA